jgi:hypothetical protein
MHAERHLAFAAGITLLLAASGARAQQPPEAEYRVNLPSGWQAVKSGAGHIVFASPDPLEYAYVRPILQRTSDCATTLRQSLTSRQAGAAALDDLRVTKTGRGTAIARYSIAHGAGRGATLCAETSRGAGMFYGAVVPSGAFAREWPSVMAVLRSFAYEPASRGKNGASAAVATPALRSWMEPHERAYTLSVPSGWQIGGGVTRQDATHYTSGVQALSPDGVAGVRIGDPRLADCTVPGPGMRGMPPAQGTMRFCQAREARDVGASYVRGMLAHDLELSDIDVSATDRADLARRAEAIPASFGLRVLCSVAELRFRALRRGSPVTGAVVVKTTLFSAAQGQNFIAGTLSSNVNAFWGPAERFAALARLTGTMEASQRINPVWWQQTQQINAEIAQRTLAQMHAEAEAAQQQSWDRMAAADRRSESVGYILSGTSKLSDGQGHTYEAKAGSNYYFLDASGTAVVGTNTWPSHNVDLQQLTVIR